MEYIEDLWKPFIIGGVIIASSKLASEFVGPAFAPIVGGMPTGIIASYFLVGQGSQEEKKKYFAGYTYSAFVLFLAILFIHLISEHTTFNVDIISTVALIIWAVVSYFVIVLAGL